MTAVVIASDSRAALMQLRHPDRGTPCVANLSAKLCAVRDRGCDIVLQWVPSHIGLPGNEAADRLAKNAHGDSAIPESDAVTPFDVARNTIHRRLMARHPDPRVASGNSPRLISFVDFGTRARRLLLRIRVGCVWTAERRQRIGGVGDGLCADCGALETVDHLLYLTGGPVECVAVTVRLGGTDTTVASVYVRPGNPWDARLIVRLTQRIKQNLLICGDFNCRHVEWGSRTSSRQGCDVLDAIRAAGLNLLNTGSPTFVRPSCTPTAIDLSVASPDCAYDWSTHPDTAGSDHLPIDILPRTERPADKVTYSVVQWSRFRELCEENSCEPHSFFDHIAACASGATIRCAVLPGTPVPDIKLLNLRAARRRAQRRARRTNKPAHWTIYKRLDAACLRHAKRLRRRSWISVCRALDEPRAQARGWRILSSMLHYKAPRFPALSIAVAKG
ncbi:hypothetical protein V5799_031455 [Amblyomma americanum]|uniref:Endonuclease/exonuclease/phosphatase domain-containing protein n=1 Tax=Amblyomma americanum TaxID=6943 RepID=A0AAQ4EKL3_AMBAM